MKHALPILFLSSVLIACATAPAAKESEKSLVELSDEIILSLFDNSESHNIAILPFDNNGMEEEAKFSKLLQDELISAVFRNNMKNIAIYERSNLNKILEEQTMSLGGLTETHLEVGRLVSAREIVTGSVSLTEGGMIVHARILDVETGAIINSVSESAKSGSLARLEQIDNKINDGTYRVNEIVLFFDIPEDIRVDKIILKNGTWTEYNKKGEILCQGEFKQDPDYSFEVKWTKAAQNMMGGSSRYEYVINGALLSVRIISVDNIEIGYLEMEV